LRAACRRGSIIYSGGRAQRRTGCAHQECIVCHRPRHPIRPPKNPWRARGGGAKKIGDSLPPGRRRHYSFGLGCGEVVYTSLKLLPGFSVYVYIYIYIIILRVLFPLCPVSRPLSCPTTRRTHAHTTLSFLLSRFCSYSALFRPG